jgi:hypothetical protein
VLASGSGRTRVSILRGGPLVWVDRCPARVPRGQKGEVEKGEVEMEVEVGVEDYDEIESLMGEYFDDVKVTGSDCGND